MVSKEKLQQNITYLNYIKNYPTGDSCGIFIKFIMWITESLYDITTYIIENGDFDD